jgi:lipocalin
MKSIAWATHTKGQSHAVGPYHFTRPVNEREARRAIVKWLELARMPAHTLVWPVQVDIPTGVALRVIRP